MPEANRPRVVHVISHGPHCLDGVAAAAAIARYYEGTEVRPRFSGNTRINEVVAGLELVGDRLDDQELWITDISWTAPEADARLRELAARGLPIYWIDHHRTAIERLRQGKIDVPFAAKVVDDRYAAARLAYDFLEDRLRKEGRSNPRFAKFRPIVDLADDNDRWLHELEGSWKLALTLRSLNGAEAFDELLALEDPTVYTPRLQAAYEKVEREMRESFELAEATRSTRGDGDVTIVAAVCDGYPSEIADRWGKETRNAVFALFDLKGGAISYRRSPDCEVDLSALAQTFGGGGHPAAAGSEMPELLVELGRSAAERVAGAVRKLRHPKGTPPRLTSR